MFEEWSIPMRTKKKILSVLIVLHILVIYSCSDNSNPILPINSGHSKILFQANNQLNIINADGSNFQLVPTQGLYTFVAKLSSDASKVVYGSVDTDTTYQQILLYNFRSNETIKITDDNLFHDSPVISPDNNCVLYLTRRDWKNDLYLYNILNGEVKQINCNLNAFNPNFSADGSKIVCYGNNGGDSVGIFVMNIDGGDLTFIKNGSFPVFSPDGKKILYQKFIPPYDNGLYIMNTDGTEDKLLSLIPFQTNPRFSPDGSRIIFSKFTTNFDIYLINIDGSNLINLTNSDTEETQPVFTPDGSRIVFTQYDNITNTMKLYSMKIDGTDKKVIFEDSSNLGIKIF
uniref:TolB protein n=1 Tax=Ignavibacterium album TaxID=591197 RepID=A0A7V2ZIF6_9BACT